MIKRSSDFYKDEVKSSKQKKKLTKAEAFQKASSFCAYQERTQQEVRDKLFEFEITGEEIEEIISRLIVENFINEERFARSFAGGKFRIKKWGRNKILSELKARRLSDYCIKKAMSEIDDNEYVETLKKLLNEKAKSVKESNSFKKNHKISTYLISKGYEPDLVWDCIKAIL